uniref:DUF7477 domain-containing protein n=1 Tax=Physcomitrium patens TaxID=3218 RepID=A0A2K1IWR9_PHYPA|nr:hypothetical protein PHYPA_023531 [Physcomitrium patens]
MACLEDALYITSSKFEHWSSKGCNYGPPCEWQVYKLTRRLLHHATRWKNGTTGQHVEYDQRPNVFRYNYDVADSWLTEHVEKNNEDGLYVSNVASCTNLWALIMDARTGFTAQVHELSHVEIGA